MQSQKDALWKCLWILELSEHNLFEKYQNEISRMIIDEHQHMFKGLVLYYPVLMVVDEYTNETQL